MPLRPATRTFTRLTSTYRLAPATWSLNTLLPSSPTSGPAAPRELNESTLAHLHALSALPPNSSSESRERTTKLLLNHLHFVRAVQSVDTGDVTPLARIEDEAEPAEISWSDVNTSENQMAEEEWIGPTGEHKYKPWRPMELPKKKIGSFYVVDEKATAEEVEEEGEKGR